MLFPNVLATPIKQALTSMGADLTEGKDTVFHGLFNSRMVICYSRGDFVEIICKHEPTYNQILQIVNLLVKDEENSEI